MRRHLAWASICVLASGAPASAQAPSIQAPSIQAPSDSSPMPAMSLRPQGGHETLPTSRLLVEAAAALRSPGHDEVSLRALANGPKRAALKVGRADDALMGGDAAATLPRLAVSAAPGPAAFLIRIAPADPTAATPDLAQPVYALATASLTRISVWSFFRGLPDDATLSGAIARVMAHTQPVLLQFDPTFKPGTEPGPQKYLLKSRSSAPSERSAGAIVWP